MRGTPLDHRCGRVAKLALERRRVQWHCPRAPTPEPGKGRRPKNRHSSKAKRVSALVSCLIPVLACLCWGFPGSGSLVLRPCPFGFLFVFCSASCFFLLAAGVTFQLPAGGTSGQAQRHRPKNRYRAPTQGPVFSGTIYVRLSCVPRVPDYFFPLHFAIYFLRMLWGLQWLSSTPAAPHTVGDTLNSKAIDDLST